MSGETKRPPSDDLRPAAPQGRTDAAGAPAVFDAPSAVAQPARKSLVREYAEAIIVAMLLAFAIRVFVVQAFKIPSGSMIPTLLIGDHILVSKLSYGIQWPSQCKFSAGFPPINCYASQAAHRIRQAAAGRHHRVPVSRRRGKGFHQTGRGDSRRYHPASQ